MPAAFLYPPFEMINFGDAAAQLAEIWLAASRYRTQGDRG
jgi:hypothetical protein